MVAASLVGWTEDEVNPEADGAKRGMKSTIETSQASGTKAQYDSTAPNKVRERVSPTQGGRKMEENRSENHQLGA